jgi:hypothetical protein
VTRRKNKLTAKQTLFVANIVAGMNQTDAAIAAGYVAKHAPQSGYHAMQSEIVLDAITAASNKQIRGNVPKMLGVLDKIACQSIFPNAALAAAKAVLGYAGIVAINKSEHRVIIDDNRTDAELLAFIASHGFLRPSGDLAQLPAPQVIDTTYETVDVSTDSLSVSAPIVPYDPFA